MLFEGKMQVAGCKSDTQSEFAVGKLVSHRHGVNRWAQQEIYPP